MELGKHYSPGVHTDTRHTGQHRELEMPQGVGLIPLGDRNRDIMEYGISYIEERGSVDISTSRFR